MDMVDEIRICEDKRIVVKFRYMAEFEKTLDMVGMLPSEKQKAAI